MNEKNWLRNWKAMKNTRTKGNYHTKWNEMCSPFLNLLVVFRTPAPSRLTRRFCFTASAFTKWITKNEIKHIFTAYFSILCIFLIVFISALFCRFVNTELRIAWTKLNWPKNANFTIQNQRSTDYKRSTLSTNKRFPLKHTDPKQLSTTTKKPNWNWNNTEKTQHTELKEEQTTNLLFRPSSYQTHAYFSFQPVDSNGTNTKKNMQARS